MKNSDKPAHPVEPDKIGTTNGLTKREMFAMAAMQGILAHSTNYMAADPSDAAKDAIKCADELLKQLDTNP